MNDARILQGDCRWYMQRFGCQVDAVITDPPYGLEFMGVAWDSMRASGRSRTRNEWGDFGSREHARGPHDTARIQRNKSVALYDFSLQWARLCLQVLKPGGRLLAFGAPRTHHRIWCAIEDAGFVIEDTVSWLFGSGFPKHKSKLKPFAEFICVARKGPVTALNIDATRVGTERTVTFRRGHSGDNGIFGNDGRKSERSNPPGRWPPNVAMDLSAAEMLDAQTGTLASDNHPAKRRGIGFTESAGGQNAGTNGERRSTDSGGASRFLYVAKASRAERELGLDGEPRRVRRITEGHGLGPVNTSKGDGSGLRENRPTTNPHPTVKPLALMRWLVKLVTQPGDLVLDPFAGSGTTGMACVLEGREFIGIERETEYAAIAERRIANALGPLFADTNGAA